MVMDKVVAKSRRDEVLICGSGARCRTMTRGGTESKAGLGRFRGQLLGGALLVPREKASKLCRCVGVVGRASGEWLE